ncbi:MAG: LPS biosynthesis protein WbpP [Candidatus Omnitrophica bacterium CG11_big_fil_rev_8_21_14_0_20_64_10]|nr:MAG: LPS biosynthesis protein WbpP [Candidatus Omnitrophica bacterium CG11_big_fil_rev_8_21_14_0_20_64_10]
MKKRSAVKTALVTGGAGFIGSHLAEALLRRGFRVRVLDNLSTGSLDNLRGLRGRIQWIRGDIRTRQTVRRAVAGVDVVFHEAAARSVPESVVAPLTYDAINVGGTLQMLEVSRKAGVRRFIFASSSSVYGETRPPHRETLSPAPLSPYAVSKLAGEAYCQMVHRLHGLETVALRYFNVFGPRQSLESAYAVVVPKFIASILRGERPPIHGDGFQSRDFTFVENVVQANLRAATAAGAPGRIFNIATGKPHSVVGLARTLARLMGSPIRPRFGPERAGDVRDSKADVRLARRVLRYRPTVDFETGLVRTIAWFSKRLTA